jgi:hypothetical protein
VDKTESQVIAAEFTASSTPATDTPAPRDRTRPANALLAPFASLTQPSYSLS